jgi:hypothetical protein
MNGERRGRALFVPVGILGQQSHVVAPAVTSQQKVLAPYLCGTGMMPGPGRLPATFVKYEVSYRRSLRQQSRWPVLQPTACLVPHPCCFLGQHQAGVETSDEVVRLSSHSSQRGQPFPRVQRDAQAPTGEH